MESLPHLGLDPTDIPSPSPEPPFSRLLLVLLKLGLALFPLPDTSQDSPALV